MTRRLVLFAALAAILAPMNARAEGIGADDYGRRCARCHSVGQALDRLKAHPEAKERAEWLARFLARHHARDAGERAPIIAYLEGALAAAKK